MLSACDPGNWSAREEEEREDGRENVEALEGGSEHVEGNEKGEGAIRTGEAFVFLFFSFPPPASL